ncbi:cytochrome c oxidase assembly protein [Alicyclobacillus sp. SO9]|uniref:cytochrome c oxidase assembly protein n=1 Tax=Alicyclobacillus sp. SO9 TaxID=2665646 RepID=UPI0018E7EA31|nr:cytochrome c oxidase assembly protein [Alicyclobacillus sp. SO9]QQE77137.1 cytochrome c oxidase assembly protein [Alicyclobacillus sp. SO9]
MIWALSHANPRDLWQPSVLAVAVAIQLIYLILVHGPAAYRLFRVRHVTTAKQTISFLIGCWLMYFSFGGPLDYLSDNFLFSAHMVQHMIEIIVMTPLVLKGLPLRAYHFLWNSKATRRLIRTWAHPLVAGAVFNIVLSMFHTPPLYNLTLINDPFHFFEHSVFFVIASFMWAPLLIESPELPRLSSGQRLLYLLYNYNLMMPIVVLLFFAKHPWYPFYVHAPRIVSWLTPMGDMQLGAVIMMVFMAGAYGTFALKEYFAQDELVWYA